VAHRGRHQPRDHSSNTTLTVLVNTLTPGGRGNYTGWGLGLIGIKMLVMRMLVSPCYGYAIPPPSTPTTPPRDKNEERKDGEGGKGTAMCLTVTCSDSQDDDDFCWFLCAFGDVGSWITHIKDIKGRLRSQLRFSWIFIGSRDPVFGTMGAKKK
jgi:hypothetical protein